MSIPVKEAGVHRQICPLNNQRYTLAIPDGYTRNREAPLILILHWGWGKEKVPPYFGKSNLVKWVQPALQDLNIILVAPDCLHRNWTNPQSEADINLLLAYLQDEYNIAADKRLIIGKSKGGRGVWYLAERNQAKFAAAIIVAGEPLPHSAEVQWQMPLYIIHSRADERFPFMQIEQVVSQLQAKGGAVQFAVLEDITHYEYEGYIELLQAVVPWIRLRIA